MSFETALLGRHCWLELGTGERIELPVARWHTDRPDPGDELLLGRCEGPTVDLGCGPGRLTAALTARGIVTLGVDSSPVAVRLTRQRGGVALRRDVFGRLPGEGRWQHVLLADGNIGIGGDPVALLRRTAALLTTGGTALIELAPPGTGLRRERVRVEGGGWFSWAWLGVDALSRAAEAAGLRLGWTATTAGRWFAALERS